MGLLSRLFSGDLQAGTPGPADPFWYRPAGGVMTPAGLRVDEDGAQKLSAWFRGRLILQIVLAMLPFPIYTRLPNDGGAEPALDHPLYDVLHDQPNDAQDSFQWRCEKMGHLIDHGHAYDWIVPGARGFVHQLVPIEPTLVTRKQQLVTLANGAAIPGRMLYDIKDARTGRTSTFTQDEIFHLHTPSGKGILEHARSSLGIALATEGFAAATFGRGSLNGGVIEVPGVLDTESSKRMALSFVTAAGDWRLPKVLEQGSSFKESTLSPEDFQMLLSRRFSVDDQARWLGVPRQMLENSDPSFGNAEQFWQSFLTIGMGGWLSLFEFGTNSQLILAPKKYFARFTRNAINRADLQARWTAHVAAVNAGIVSVDEVRGVEDLNKRGGKADELREPQNITGKPLAPSPGDASSSAAHADAIVVESAARLLRKEITAIQKDAVRHAADQPAFTAFVRTFYQAHAGLVAQTLQMPPAAAERYCASQQQQLLASVGGWVPALELWSTPAYAAGLAALALEAA